jgi:hypothetical protein
VQLARGDELDLERIADLGDPSPLARVRDRQDEGDDRRILRTQARGVDLDLAPQRHGAGDEIGDRRAEPRARPVPRMQSAHALVGGGGIRMAVLELAARRVDPALPREIEIRRPQRRVLQAPLPKADDRLGQIGGARRGLRGVGHCDGTGSRAGGRSRSGTAGGCLGTTGAGA